ncbi:MAG TPA: pirin family protein [Noviherbaspirillum sp.]|nr:pirin family protein [Noviherbaspirillum sp.]
MPHTAFHLIKPHVKELGDGFTVRRSLPSHPHKMVGPFIFFDHMGPAHLEPGGLGLQVRPHPHIGLATVTYLFEGAIMHRDSLGYQQEIRPGDVNWMTAGSGIVHSERTPEHLRAEGGTMHGIQIWIALPKSDEFTEPHFEHHPGATLPEIRGEGVHLRLIAGAGFGLTSPVTTFSPLFYAALDLAPGARFTLPAEHPERAVYAVEGEVLVDGEVLPETAMAVLSAGQDTTIEAPAQTGTGARLMLLGGEPLDGDRYISWNFVASSREAIEEARQRWRERAFGKVPGETEWIPLPDERKAPESFS